VIETVLHFVKVSRNINMFKLVTVSVL